MKEGAHCMFAMERLAVSRSARLIGVLIGVGVFSTNGVAQNSGFRLTLKPGTVAQVTDRIIQVTDAGAFGDSSETIATYRLRIESHPRGLAVYFDSMQVRTNAPSNPMMRLSRLGSQLATPTKLMTPVIVTATGDFVALADSAATAKAMAEVEAEWTATIEQMALPAPIGQQMIQSLRTPGAAVGYAGLAWYGLLGEWMSAAWSDRTDTVSSAMLPKPVTSAAMPKLPDVSYYVERRVDRSIRCGDSGEVMGCTKVRSVSTPDTAAMARMMDEAMKAGAAAAGAPDDVPRIRTSGVRTESMMTIDPSGSRPLLSRTTTSSDTRVAGMIVSMRMTRERVFQYAGK
jgi:hypothetical protein